MLLGVHPTQPRVSSAQGQGHWTAAQGPLPACLLRTPLGLTLSGTENAAGQGQGLPAPQSRRSPPVRGPREPEVPDPYRHRPGVHTARGRQARTSRGGLTSGGGW